MQSISAGMMQLICPADQRPLSQASIISILEIDDLDQVSQDDIKPYYEKKIRLMVAVMDMKLDCIDCSKAIFNQNPNLHRQYGERLRRNKEKLKKCKELLEVSNSIEAHKLQEQEELDYAGSINGKIQTKNQHD